MKKILILLLLPLFLGSTSKYEYKFEAPFAPIVFAGINDSIPTIDQFGRIRNGIIAQRIIDTLNNDPSGVDLTESELAYVRSIVGGLYVTGMWQKSVALYGFVGGNAWKHKWNWKDMRDLDSAYRLTTSGTIIHNFDGVKSSGGSYNTNMNANELIPDDCHLSIYMNTSFSTSANQIGTIEPGSGTRRNFLSIRGGTTLFNSSGTGTQDDYNVSGNLFKGYVLANSTAPNVRSIFYKSAYIPRSSTNNRGDDFNFSNTYTILQVSGAVDTSNTFCFASLGSGLTDQQAIQTSNIVTYAQGILSRQ